MSAAEHPDTAEGVFYRAASAANVAANAAYAANVEALRAVYEAARAEGEAARAEGEAAGAARERAAVVDYLREQAEDDHDPWILHLADDVAAGQHWGVEAAMREAGAAMGAR